MGYRALSARKAGAVAHRAGKVFATLTSGSFNDLCVEYDDNDSAQLAGVRPDGALVRVGGMSTGTADQLYLALRVASVEDYLDRCRLSSVRRRRSVYQFR